jgi:hypothetical protein
LKGRFSAQTDHEVIDLQGSLSRQSIAMRALPGARTLADHASESAGEMGLIRKSDVDGDLRELTPAFQ